VRRGASWTAAYHLQLTVAAVARPVPSGVDALGVLAAERSWWLLAQTTFARRSVQPGSRGRASSPWSTRPAATPRRRSPVCPAWVSTHPVSVSGIRLSSRPVSGHLGSSSSGSDARPSAVHPSGVQPSGVCPVRPHASVSSHAQAVALGTRSRWPGDPDHRNRWGPRWLAGRRRLDRRSRRLGRGRHCPSRVGRWEVGGGPGPPVGCGRRPRLPAERPGRPGRRAERPSRAAALWAREQVAARGGGTRGVAGVLGLGARPRWVVVAGPAGRVGGPGGARGCAGGDGRAAPARPKPTANAPGPLPAAL
jgi:hypothetical protein